MSRGIKFLCMVGVIFLCTSCFSPSVIKIGGGEEKVVEDPPTLEPTATKEPTPTPGIVDCLDDLDCFNSRLEGCQEASLLYSQGLNMMGAEIETTLLLTVFGWIDDLCQFSVVTDQISISISDEAVQQLLAAGKTEEEIEGQRQMLEQSQESARFDEVCTGNPTDLIAVLGRWEQGQFSLNDWEPFSCEGKIFSGMMAQADPTDEPPPTVEAQPPSNGNFLGNMSFEADPQLSQPAWEITNQTGDLAAEWSKEAARTGDYGLKLSTAESASTGFPGWIMLDSVPLEEEVWHLFEVWAFTPDGADAFVGAAYLDEAGQVISSQGTGCVDLELGTWQKVGFGITEARLAGVSAVRLSLQQCTSETEGTLTHIYYDDIYFGNTPQ